MANPLKLPSTYASATLPHTGLVAYAFLKKTTASSWRQWTPAHLAPESTNSVPSCAAHGCSQLMITLSTASPTFTGRYSMLPRAIHPPACSSTCTPKLHQTSLFEVSLLCPRRTLPSIRMTNSTTVLTSSRTSTRPPHVSFVHDITISSLQAMFDNTSHRLCISLAVAFFNRTTGVTGKEVSSYILTNTTINTVSGSHYLLRKMMRCFT